MSRLIRNVLLNISIDDVYISFKKCEKIHTENSYKYSVSDFIDLLELIGYKSLKYLINNKNYFSLLYFKN